MKDLRLSKKARRKARRDRLKAKLGIVGFIATLLGVPGANLGAELLGNHLGHNQERLSRADLSGITTSETAEALMRMRGNLFQNRPTPTPSQETDAPEEPSTSEGAEIAAAPEPAPGSITDIVYSAAAEFGLDGGYLLSVASCESGLDPGAVNPVGYHGLFQFGTMTWDAYGYGSIYDPVAQARTAARMLASGMASRWPNCA